MMGRTVSVKKAWVKLNREGVEVAEVDVDNPLQVVSFILHFCLCYGVLVYNKYPT